MIEEGQLVQEVWDLKRIIIGVFALVVVVGGGYAVKTMVLDAKSPRVTQKSTGNVEGAQTQELEVGEIKESIQQKIDTLKNQVTNLNAQDVASSSPQIQKVLQDIKNLEKYPKDQAKQMCQQICSTL